MLKIIVYSLYYHATNIRKFKLKCEKDIANVHGRGGTKNYLLMIDKISQKFL